MAASVPRTAGREPACQLQCRHERGRGVDSSGHGMGSQPAKLKSCAAWPHAQRGLPGHGRQGPLDAEGPVDAFRATGWPEVTPLSAVINQHRTPDVCASHLAHALRETSNRTQCTSALGPSSAARTQLCHSEFSLFCILGTLTTSRGPDVGRKGYCPRVATHLGPKMVVV